MKIRSQFFFLIIGILIVPILVMSFIAFISYFRTPESTLVPGYREVSAISTSGIDREAWARFTRFMVHKPRDIDCLVLDANSVVLFSTIPGIKQTDILPDSQIFSLIRNTSQQYLYQLDTPSVYAKGKFLVISRIPREKNRPRDQWAALLTVTFIVLAALIAFSSIMSVIIAGSITRSMTILEESTRRIAAGELDLAIDAKGSNEITSLTVSLNRMRLALKEEQNRRSRFIMGVSHDLKTPLALIKGYTEAIADGLADDPAMMQKSLAIVGNKVDQLEGMIDDLIGFVKLDTGEWRRSLEPRPVAPLLRTFVKRITEDANLLKRNVTSSILLADDVTAALDERLFIRALDNIVNNSLRYTPQGGTVGIEARRGETDILISVSDDGPGIAKEDIPKIFDLFYRGSNSRREEGMGLGLSVVKSVADSHGWRIDVDSTVGKGSVFTIVIPESDNAHI
jgi:signal transduction histidine kinase